MYTRRRTSLAVAAMLSMTLASTFALAQSATGASPGISDNRPQSAVTAPGDRSAIVPPDRQFIERAAAGGMAEVQLGQLAQQKASSDEVKVFAARMVREHTESNAELMRLAQAKGIGLPADVPKSAHGDIDKVGKLSGAEFDRQYMQHMVSDHRKTVAEFKKASESARDLEVKAFAGKTLPRLQDHLNQAQAIQKSVRSASN